MLSRSLSFQDVYNFLDGSLDQGTPAAASSPGTVKALMKYSRYLSGREDLAAGSNNITGIMHAAEAGIGIAALPDYLAADRRGLQRILPDTEGPTFDVHLVYCDALRQSKRVAAFRDFLVRAAKDWRY